jgi:alpha-beta hydrolase superfamily lysophospholipase
VGIEFIRTISEGKKIYGILHLPRTPAPPCVIISHGLFSSKESDKFAAIGETFSAQGIAVIRYDHQGCGESKGNLSATTTSSRIQDLEAICDLALQHPLLGDHLGLLGSSMGGFISIFKGASDPRVRALVLWATPVRLERNKQGPEEDVLLHKTFYDDAEHYNAEEAIKSLSNCLLLHGKKDEIVPFSHARTLYRAAQTPKHLEAFPEGDHRFTDPQDRRRAIELSLAWFQKYL